MAKRSPQSTKMYICLDCGREFKAQGIGPHQRTTGHSGRSEPTMTIPPVIPGEVEKSLTGALARPVVRDTNSRQIQRHPSWEIVTDGTRVGIVIWDPEVLGMIPVK